MQRSRVGELSAAEGLRWRYQETWFGAPVNPDLAEDADVSKRLTTPPKAA